MNKKADEYKGMDGGKNSLRQLQPFESFKNPVFRVYYGSMVGNWFAMSMQIVVRSLLIYRLTGSATIIGVMSLASAIPTLLVSLLGGAVADRVQKKYILFAGRAASAVLTLGIALALTLGYLSPERSGSWWLLIFAAVLEGIVNGFLMPTNMAIIPEIVSRERVMNAISLSTVGQNVFRLVGPALGGFLIDAYGFAVVYYLMTGMHIVATVFASLLPRTSARTTRGGNPLADMLEGLRYIGRETTILLLVVFSVCHIISGQPFQQLLPVFTEDILKVSASKLGLLTSVSGVGAMLGSLVLASLPNRKRGALLLLSGVIMGLPIIVFSFSHWWYLSLVMMPFIGLGPTMHMTLTATLVQSYAEPDYRARMQSFVTMASGLASLGTFLAGVLAEAIGVQWSIGGMAIFLTLISIIFLTFVPRLRKLD